MSVNLSEFQEASNTLERGNFYDQIGQPFGMGTEHIVYTRECINLKNKNFLLIDENNEMDQSQKN